MNTPDPSLLAEVLRHALDGIAIVDGAGGAPRVVYANATLAALLRRALQTLPESLRVAVLLRDIQELSYLEIAERLRLPEGTVKSRINRGRKELARQILRLREEADGRRVHGRRPGNGQSGVLE